MLARGLPHQAHPSLHNAPTAMQERGLLHLVFPSLRLAIGVMRGHGRVHQGHQ